MGVDSHADYALRRPGSRTSRHPREFEAAARGARAASTGWCVYRAGAERPTGPRATPSARPTCCAGPSARRNPGQGSSRTSRAAGNTALRPAIQAILGCPGAVRRLCLQQGAHRGLRPDHLLDHYLKPLPTRHRHAASSFADDEAGGAVPERVPPDGVEVLTADVDGSVATFQAVAATSGSAWRPSAMWRHQRGRGHARHATPRASSASSPFSCVGSRRWCPTSGSSSR